MNLVIFVITTFTRNFILFHWYFMNKLYFVLWEVARMRLGVVVGVVEKNEPRNPCKIRARATSDQSLPRFES